MGRDAGSQDAKDKQGNVIRAGNPTLQKEQADAKKQSEKENKDIRDRRLADPSTRATQVSQELNQIFANRGAKFNKQLDPFTVTRGINPKTGIAYTGPLTTKTGQAVFTGDKIERDKILDYARKLSSFKAEPYTTPLGPNFDSISGILQARGFMPKFPTSTTERVSLVFDPDSAFAPGGFYGTRVNNPLNNLKALQQFDFLEDRFANVSYGQDSDTSAFDLTPLSQVGFLNMDEYYAEKARREEAEARDEIARSEGRAPITVTKTFPQPFLEGYNPTDYMSDSLRKALLPDQNRLFNDFLTDRTINQFDLNEQTLLPQASPKKDTPLFKKILNPAAQILGGLVGFNPVKSNTYFGELNPENYFIGDMTHMKTPANYDPMKYNNPLDSIKQLGNLANQDFFGNLISKIDIQPNDLEAGRRANRGPGDGPRIPLPGDFVDLPQPPGGDGGPEATPPPIGFGTIDPGANYNKLYGFTAANGGRVPPMSGPMSNGLGNLFKMK